MQQFVGVHTNLKIVQLNTELRHRKFTDIKETETHNFIVCGEVPIQVIAFNNVL